MDEKLKKFYTKEVDKIKNIRIRADNPGWQYMDSNGIWIPPPSVRVRYPIMGYITVYIHGCDVDAIVVYQISNDQSYDINSTIVYDIGEKTVSKSNISNIAGVLSNDYKQYMSFGYKAPNAYITSFIAQQEAIKTCALAIGIESHDERTKFMIDRCNYSFTISNND